MVDVDKTTDLTHLTASELGDAIRAGEVTAAAVVEAHIERIEAVNPALNALVIPLFDEARHEARALDQAQQDGAPLGALHGVPVTIKEQFRVAGTQTTLGASEKIGNVAHDEGPLVGALRRAGAVILGKTNIMQTLAGWESDNPVYGRTNNPWNLDRTPGGSSGGEAAIVAAGGSALGLAGDLGGSIRVPAHFCGVHGFKPTSGRLTNADFAPGLLSTGQEIYIAQPGPIARSVADLSLAMAVFAETSMDPTPDVVAPVPWRDPADVDVSTLRIGVALDNGYFPLSPAVARAVERAAAVLDDAGATVEPIRLPEADEGVRLFLAAASSAGSQDLLELLGDEKPIPQLAGLVRGARTPAALRPIVGWLMERRGLHHLAREIGWLGRRSAAAYQDLAEARSHYRVAFADALASGPFDAVICPPVATPAFPHGTSQDLLGAVSYAFVYNVIGAPAGVVAATRVRPDEQSGALGDDHAPQSTQRVDHESAGLPVGVQVVGRHWHDHIVLAVMAAIEQRLGIDSEYPSRAVLPF